MAKSLPGIVKELEPVNTGLATLFREHVQSSWDKDLEPARALLAYESVLQFAPRDSWPSLQLVGQSGHERSAQALLRTVPALGRVLRLELQQDKKISVELKDVAAFVVQRATRARASLAANNPDYTRHAVLLDEPFAPVLIAPLVPVLEHLRAPLLNHALGLLLHDVLAPLADEPSAPRPDVTSAPVAHKPLGLLLDESFVLVPDKWFAAMPLAPLSNMPSEPLVPLGRELIVPVVNESFSMLLNPLDLFARMLAQSFVPAVPVRDMSFSRELGAMLVPVLNRALSSVLVDALRSLAVDGLGRRRDESFAPDGMLGHGLNDALGLLVPDSFAPVLGEDLLLRLDMLLVALLADALVPVLPFFVPVLDESLHDAFLPVLRELFLLRLNPLLAPVLDDSLSWPLGSSPFRTKLCHLQVATRSWA
ncbi:hypothetical protein AURDEDRAFT_163623 [Auricularia subglabra TFB-10046 SS5]|nr:hypothetical protein AURDEDRAFT_163623 [Auricularia subglabra TFB-10046 SS5]